MYVGTVWLAPDNTLVYVMGQSQYVERVLQGGVGVDPVCMEAVGGLG